MPRANRRFLPGNVWHLTHRCHQKKFLLKFARDRRRYLRSVFETGKRFGLSVQLDGTYTLREEIEAYGADFTSENATLTLDNTIPWEDNVESTET